MAESGEPGSLDSTDDLLTCSVCLEEYQDPRALPCLHTFCYKCLVGLSMDAGDEGSGPSETSLQVTALKLEFSSYVIQESAPKIPDALCCPLCTEKHPIPKEGVAGFRKDFRIKSMLDQRQKSVGSAGDRSWSLEEPQGDTPVPDTCSLHNGEKLKYHCETEGCKRDICETCWGSTHDGHNVKLLAKKVKDAREALQQQIQGNIAQISQQVSTLVATREGATDKFNTAEAQLQSRYKDLQEQLTAAFSKSSQELSVQKQLQIKKIEKELQGLAAMHDTFKQIGTGLEKENAPQTSRTCNKYDAMTSKLSAMGDSLEDWSFNYSTPHVQGDEGELGVETALGVTFTEETLGRSPTEDETEEGEAGPKARKGRGGRQQKRVQKQAKQEAAGKQRKEKGKKGEAVAAVVPPLIARGKSQNVDELKFEYFIVQKKPNVENIAITKGGDLFIATAEQFCCYGTSPAKRVFEYNIQNESVDAIAMVTSKSDNVEFLVKLDAKAKMVKFFSSRGKTHPYDSISNRCATPTGVLKFVASWGPFVCYPYMEGDKLLAALATLESAAPCVLAPFGTPIQVPFTRLRGMCMYVSAKGNPILVCTNAFTLGKTAKTDLAVVAVTKQTTQWKLTFNDLDADATNFDLKGVACDNKNNVYVLNNRANVVYHVSKNGACVTKMGVMGGPPKFHFSGPYAVTLDPNSKSLFVAHHKEVITKFSLS